MDQPPTLSPVPQSDPIGDAASLRRIYDQYGATVYRFCCQTLPAHLAEEATQDVFVQVWRNRHRYDRTRGTLIAWLMGIAKLRVIDLARREQRHSRRRADGESPDLATSEPTTSRGDEPIEQLAIKAVVAEALRALPDRQRNIVTMAYVEGLTQQEISLRTETPLGTVKSDIRRGLQTIRQHLEGTDV